MKIHDVPFSVTDWSKIVPTEHKGEIGASFWRTFETGNIFVRVIELSSGYKAYHWCGCGHVVLVLEGELINELRDGREFKVGSGMSFQIADNDDNPHRAYTEKDVQVFIVD